MLAEYEDSSNEAFGYTNSQLKRVSKEAYVIPRKMPSSSETGPQSSYNSSCRRQTPDREPDN
jgi:hypothetical protein